MSIDVIRLSPEQSNSRRSRPTIALFSDELRLHIPVTFLRSAAAVAQAADANFLYFSSEPVRSPFYFEIQANIFYEMLNPANVDGILIASNLVGLYSSVAELGAFFQRYRPLPMVSMGVALDGVPSVTLDNFAGMYAAVAHLIETHGYRRIAFLGGIEEHPEAKERYRAYTTALQDHGVSVDPGLVTHGNFQPASGTAAAQLWFDERHYRPRQDIEAVVAANDYMAVGLMLELQHRGIRVPEEIAVTGFDDVVISRAFTPSLTTVRQPFDEIGRQATRLLLAGLDGQTIPSLTRVPAGLVTRQSCGCTAAEARQVKRSGQVADIFRRDPRAFFHQLNQIIYDTDSTVALKDGSLVDSLALLRDEQAWRAPDTQVTASGEPETQIRPALGETILGSLQEKRDTQFLQRLGERIIATLNVPELMGVLAEDVPRLGIRSAYLVLYDDPPPYQFPQPVPAWSRLVLAYDVHGRRTLPPDGLHFPTSTILPPEVLVTDDTRQMVVESLYFQREQIGFAVFEVGTPDENTYGALRRYLSSSLQGALLVQRVQEHSAEIARQKYILDTFLETVPDRIWFKDQEGRYLRANQAHARRWGLRDPAEEIGKTDVDLMPHGAAQVTNADERQILDTGVPLVSKEAKSVEPDGSIKWSLVTKMPLRDEHGAIIGTFGIARDITELKKAQQALAQAYSEISVLNVQLQEENVRMGAELNVVKRLQQMILPRPEELENIPHFDIAGYMQPADEVGGDYYDVLHGDGLLHIGIGDVTGHGLESGVMMLMTQAAIRTLIEHGETDPVKFVNTLNRLIYKNAQRIGTDKNLTFALVQYQHGQFKLVGQHEELLVVRQNGQVERVNTMDLGFPVGLEAEISQWVNAATITLQPGDGIVLYTDGITEAENSTEDLYGIDRLCDVISRSWAKPVEAIKQAVIDDVFAHIGMQTVYDDLTLVILKQK